MIRLLLQILYQCVLQLVLQLDFLEQTQRWLSEFSGTRFTIDIHSKGKIRRWSRDFEIRRTVMDTMMGDNKGKSNIQTNGIVQRVDIKNIGPIDVLPRDCFLLLNSMTWSITDSRFQGGLERKLYEKQMWDFSETKTVNNNFF